MDQQEIVEAIKELARRQDGVIGQLDAMLNIRTTDWNDAQEKIGTLEAQLADKDKEIERLRVFEPTVALHNFPDEVAIQCAKGFLAQLIQSFEVLNRDSNYTETTISSGGVTYKIEVRRADKPTPHELRKSAETQITDIHKELAKLRSSFTVVNTEYNELCNGLNKIIDEHGGWDDGLKTYEAHFRKIIDAAYMTKKEEKTNDQ